MATIINFPLNVNLREDFSQIHEELSHLLGTLSQALDTVQGLGAVDLEAVFGPMDAAIRRLTLASKAAVLKASIPSEDRIVVDGVEYQRMKKVTPGRYFLMEGEAVVPRALFRATGVRNGPTLDPIATRCGLMGGRYTPKAAQLAAFLDQSMPSREAETLCKLMGTLPYSRSRVFRLGQQVGELFGEHRDALEEEMARSFKIPESAHAVSIAVDRVSLPFVEEREATPQDQIRGIKRPIAVKYRMAYCGVWTLHDIEGRPLHSVRYAHIPAGGRQAIEAQLACDLDALMENRPNLKIVPLADGAQDMQGLLDRIVFPRPVAARFVDFWHLVEKLGAAVKQVKLPDKDRILATWKTDLKQRDDAIRRIYTTLTEWAIEHESEDLPEALHAALTYIYNNHKRLRYASARAACLPIASGHVEATCKCIVTTRFKRAGAHWKPDGAQPLLDLRALAMSSRWGLAMRGLFKKLPRTLVAA